MSDFALFFIGCFVSLIVLAAVGLLIWGAANEPRGSIVPQRSKTPVPPKATPETEPGVSRAAERVAG